MYPALVLLVVMLVVPLGVVTLLSLYTPWPPHLRWLRWAIPVVSLAAGLIFFLVPIGVAK